MSFQIIEIEDSQADVICPHCAFHVIDWNEDQYIQPCEHTLFIAMDLGFEFISDNFESTMSRTVDEIHADDENSNIFEEISQSNLADFIVFRSDIGVENYHRYIGFTKL